MSILIASAALAALLLLWHFAGAATGRPERPANRLAGETSPYLLQHAHNPVDWRPWSDEAFDKARREDKPVFLSVGYSTCHWCHVMAHESFEDEQVAAYLNDHFVPIKVDREQRPDVDEQYMLATQLFTGHGGWPNSVFLTPDGRPWYAGTYLPNAQFLQLLQNLQEVWTNRREDVDKQAAQFVDAIQRIGRGEHIREDRPLSADLVDQGIDRFMSVYDSRHGGFGGAPKFPPHGTLALLLESLGREDNEQRADAVRHTLGAMAHGGVYDHIGGGFHRYATDAHWFLPHFEKMLYDNAQLIANYAEAHRQTGEGLYRRVIDETFGWIGRQMTDEAGGFYSGLDADSEGEEGKYYVWTYEQLLETLGDEDGALLAEVYGATPDGNYREEATGRQTGANILHLPRPLEQIAEEKGLDAAELRDRLDGMRRKLLEVRTRRVRPELDDKVLAGWNGLMIEALARAGRALDERRYTEAAARAADFIIQRMRDENGDLLRAWRQGTASIPAYLDDYAFTVAGLLELHRATEEPRRFEEARSLADRMIERFHDDAGGGFFSSSDRHEQLLTRAKELGGGGNMPSANGYAALAMIELALATGDERYGRIAAGTLQALRGSMAAHPHGVEHLLIALNRYCENADRLPPLQPEAGGEATDADAAVAKGPVRVEAYASRHRARPGQTIHLAVRVRIAEGYHIYANQLSSDELLATTLKLDGPPSAQLRTVQYPEPRRTTDPVLNTPLETYQGAVTIVAPVTVSEDAPAGRMVLQLQLQAQACSESACQAPERYELHLPIEIAADAADEPAHPELFGELGVA